MKCTNTTYGTFTAHANDHTCTSTGTKINYSVSGGCVDGSGESATVFGTAAGGSTFMSCVTSQTPYMPPAESLSVATFYPQQTCPTSLYGPANAIQNIISYVGRKCVPISGQPYSIKYDCNATTAVENVYKGDR